MVVVDDDSIVRRALSGYLSMADDIDLVGEAEDGEAATGLVERLSPDVVLMDLRMPRMGGLDATAEIMRLRPATRVVAMTTFGTADSVMPVLRAGAAGFLLKDAEPSEILEAIRLVSAGAGALSPRVSGELIRAVQGTSIASVRRPSEAECLSPREAAIVEHLASGKSNSEIARALHISEGTVKAHLSNVMVKWNARDRVQVLIAAARFGLVHLR